MSRESLNEVNISCFYKEYIFVGLHFGELVIYNKRNFQKIASFVTECIYDIIPTSRENYMCISGLGVRFMQIQNNP
jgi:hypothetical protein